MKTIHNLMDIILMVVLRVFQNESTDNIVNVFPHSLLDIKFHYLMFEDSPGILWFAKFDRSFD